MKTINTFALLIPLVLALLGIIINDGLLTLAIISTMLTGFIQIVLGIFYWIKIPKSIYIKLYFLFVILFFLIIFSSLSINWIWFLPPILCIYISVLIYSLKETS